MRTSQGRHTDPKSVKRVFLWICLIAMTVALSACGKSQDRDASAVPEAAQEKERESEDLSGKEPKQASEETLSIEEIVNSFEGNFSVEIPPYEGDAYAVMNDNIPYFTKSYLPTESFEYYAYLDELGRCGIACANIGQDIMPTEKRGDIGQVKPSGWQTIKYDQVEGKYLYNRCHLIGYQLSAENANEKNLITGTRYLNVQGMLPFENMVADYVKETGNHVLYRVIPVFEEDHLVASGVLMEGWSVEDEGEGICFNVFAYNVQPGIVIDYANGDSHLDESLPEDEEPEAGFAEPEYILNTSTKKFHVPSCGSAKQTTEKNRQEYTGTREDVINMGYAPCKNCNP